MQVSPELNRYQELLEAAEDRAKSAEEKAQDIESQVKVAVCLSQNITFLNSKS